MVERADKIKRGDRDGDDGDAHGAGRMLGGAGAAQYGIQVRLDLADEIGNLRIFGNEGAGVNAAILGDRFEWFADIILRLNERYVDRISGGFLADFFH
ncbi:hypothetical protein [Breoghania sp.]|uniref:hypothetical protein n=1 Tax=Breoghania sp. TaxID=2065378 RepID=UPI00260B7AC2|nr:hypothetical protein [Breoghania sp.]MDJ0931699.1 hypothetical protein [Breoghania sp.]